MQQTRLDMQRPGTPNVQFYPFFIIYTLQNMIKQTHCIPAWHVCDSANDCPDKSDEKDCPDLSEKSANPNEAQESGGRKTKSVLGQTQFRCLTPEIKTELKIIDSVGETIEAEAQEQIKKEKQKTGVQVQLIIFKLF